MKLFDVYSQYDVDLRNGKGAELTCSKGKKYLDFYSGHGVISIGHGHPRYVKALKEQLDNLAFYTNIVKNSLQVEMAEKLGELSGYEDYSLFLCNSGAEAVENAMKVASFHTGASRIIAMKGAFHGRTSGAVAATDNPNIQSEYNKGHNVAFIEFEDIQSLEYEVSKGDVAAILIEGIQGVGGVFEGSKSFLNFARELCDKNDICLILDEIQSGYGRTGKFFAHQYSDIKADIITTAKGMGNGFPIAGVIVAPHIKAKKGMLGTTYGGNHLACSAGIAVLDVIKEEGLIQNATEMGDYLRDELKKVENIKEIRGKGLMLGLVMEDAPEYRKKLIYEQNVFTGFSTPNVIRLLPPLNITKKEVKQFIVAFKAVIKSDSE